MLSTRDLSLLPDIARLKALCQSLALLDAILCPEWDYRYYSFNAHWSAGEEMASMRNGSGDDYFLLFTEHGAILKGFDHESEMSPYAANPPRVWPGVLESVPPVFAAFLSEPAFSMEDTTFCIWRTFADTQWQRGDIAFPDGDDPDGSAYLLARLDDNPRSYQEWAEEYYEQSIDLAAVQSLYRHLPLTPSLVTALNPDLPLADLAAELAEIGYGQA